MLGATSKHQRQQRESGRCFASKHKTKQNTKKIHDPYADTRHIARVCVCVCVYVCVCEREREREREWGEKKMTIPDFLVLLTNKLIFSFPVRSGKRREASMHFYTNILCLDGLGN